MRIEALRKTTEVRYSNNEQKVLDNVLIDYLRSLKMNYSYTVVMRERNLISEDILTKQALAELLELGDLYTSTDRFDISVLEMLFIRFTAFLVEKKETAENGVQVELLSKDKTVNNQLLN
jgi:hypothetical protein